MEHQEKIDKFLAKNARDAFREKTPMEELPFKMGCGSSTHHPERKGGISTSNIVLWCKFLDGDWFRPYGSFDQKQIESMIEICSNDHQIVSLMELLSAKKD